jgi:hypothetical protein
MDGFADSVTVQQGQNKSVRIKSAGWDTSASQRGSFYRWIRRERPLPRKADGADAIGVVIFPVGGPIFQSAGAASRLPKKEPFTTSRATTRGQPRLARFPLYDKLY